MLQGRGFQGAAVNHGFPLGRMVGGEGERFLGLVRIRGLRAASSQGLAIKPGRVDAFSDRPIFPFGL
jgi:hypothetical protein